MDFNGYRKISKLKKYKKLNLKKKPTDLQRFLNSKIYKLIKIYKRIIQLKIVPKITIQNPKNWRTNVEIRIIYILLLKVTINSTKTYNLFIICSRPYETYYWRKKVRR